MDIIKKIIKTYLISIVASQLTYMIILGMAYIVNKFYPQPNTDLAYTDLSYSFGEFVGLSILGLVWTLVSGLIVTIILYLISIVKKRVLDHWFVASFATCFFILISPMIENIWHRLIFTSIVLVIILIFIIIHRWKAKSYSQFNKKN